MDIWTNQISTFFIYILVNNNINILITAFAITRMNFTEQNFDNKKACTFKKKLTKRQHKIHVIYNKHKPKGKYILCSNATINSGYITHYLYRDFDINDTYWISKAYVLETELKTGFKHSPTYTDYAEICRNDDKYDHVTNMMPRMPYILYGSGEHLFLIYKNGEFISESKHISQIIHVGTSIYTQAILDYYTYNRLTGTQDLEIQSKIESKHVYPFLDPK